jgi:predicted ribosomally synthesized peptide with SipW-like signal peptide
MKTKTKALAMAMCAVLLVVASVFTTLAYLTHNDTVTNSFTVGNVSIVLDEADVDNSKTNTTTEGRDKKNTYKLIPGASYTKDPKITVSTGSETCWLFVKVENGLSDVIDSNNTIESQMATNNWVVIDETNGIYAYQGGTNGGKVSAGSEPVSVFDKLVISGDATNAQLKTIADNNSKITVTAYAVQVQGFDSTENTPLENAKAAWNSTFGKTTTNNSGTESNSNTAENTNS